MLRRPDRLKRQLAALALWLAPLPGWTQGDLTVAIVPNVGHSSLISSVAFSPDGRTIVSGSHDLTVKLWNAESGRKLRTLSGHRNWINAVAFSPGGRTVVSGGDDRTIKLWDAASGHELRTLVGHRRPVTALAFSPNGRTIASSSKDPAEAASDLAAFRQGLGQAGYFEGRMLQSSIAGRKGNMID